MRKSKVNLMRRNVSFGLTAFFTLSAFWIGTPSNALALSVRKQPNYRFAPPSRGGTGKFYLGREISRVFGHRAARWLDRPTREAEEKPSLLVENLGLSQNAVVADIGAGTGYFTLFISPLVPRGEIIAVDIQPKMLHTIEERSQELGVRNITTTLGEITNPKLPPSHVDLMLLVDAYHEFSHPREMGDAIVNSLKSGGRVVLVEYRGEDKDSQIKRVHRMTEAQARKEMAALGLRWLETKDILPMQHIMIFEKP